MNFLQTPVKMSPSGLIEEKPSNLITFANMSRDIRIADSRESSRDDKHQGEEEDNDREGSLPGEEQLPDENTFDQVLNQMIYSGNDH